MSDNPYSTDPVLVVAQDVQQTVIVDHNTGSETITGATVTTIATDPSGARRQVITKTLVRGDDWRLIDPTKDQVFACACGCSRTLLTSHSVVFCETCQRPISRDHARSWNDGTTNQTVCPACHAPGAQLRSLKRFLRWLTTL